MAGAIASTGKTDYTTPEYMLVPVRAFFRALKREAGGDTRIPIDLDPCGNPRSVVWARRNIQLEELTGYQIQCRDYWRSLGIEVEVGDGLDQNVRWDGCVFVNPPFGRGIGAWIRRAAAAQGVVVMLVPDTPETDVWKEVVLNKARGRCQIGHRPRFEGFEALTGAPVKNGIPKPCSFLLFGPAHTYPLFKSIFEVVGRCEEPREVYAGQPPIWTPTKARPRPPIDGGDLGLDPVPPTLNPLSSEDPPEGALFRDDGLLETGAA